MGIAPAGRDPLPQAPAGTPSPEKPRSRMVTAGGSAPHMQTITYSQQMQYATLTK
jgi:hypothetical protein